MECYDCEPTQVVTWQTPRGNKLNVCCPCEDGMNALERWWKDPETGEEFCQVAHGLHEGQCDICERGDADAGSHTIP